MNKTIRSTAQSKVMRKIAVMAAMWKVLFPERNKKTDVGQALPLILKQEEISIEVIKELKPEHIQNTRWPNS